MCTFERERRVMVCNIAIGTVEAAARAAFGDHIHTTGVDGVGTLVEASESIDAAKFDEVMMRAIVAANASAQPTAID